MREVKRSSGIFVPTSRDLLIVAVMALICWWGWQQYVEARTRRSLWDPHASATDRIRAVEAWAERGAQGVPELTQALDSDNPRTRRYIVLALARLGPRAAPAVPALLEKLNDPVADVRINSAIALTRIDEGSPRIANAVIELLSDDDLSVRLAVIEALRDWSAEPLPEVIQLLDNDSAHLRRSAVIVLRRALRGDPELASVVHRLTDDSEPHVRVAAKCAILGSGRATLDEFRQWLDEGDEEVVLTAIDGLRRLGPDGRTLVPNLMVSLGRGDERLDFRVLRALRSFQNATAPAIPAIFRFLETATLETIPDALEVLAAAGADHESLVPLLRKYVHHESHRVSSVAGRLLEELDPQAGRDEVPRLARTLRDGDRPAVDAALAALWMLGPDAAEAVPELIPRLRDREPHLRVRAAEILRRIGPAAAPAVPEIADLLQDVNATPGLTLALVETAGAIGRPARIVGPRLMELLGTNPLTGPQQSRGSVEFSAPLRCRILVAAARVGYRTPEFLTILRESLDCPSSYERMGAMEGLAALALKDRQMIPAFRAAIQDDDPSLRLTAIATAADALGPEPEVVSWLSEALSDPHPQLRRASAQVLRRMGPPARMAVPALRQALEDQENLRSAMDRPRQTGLLPIRPFAIADLTDDRDESTVADSILQALAALAETRSDGNN